MKTNRIMFRNIICIVCMAIVLCACGQEEAPQEDTDTQQEVTENQEDVETAVQDNSTTAAHEMEREQTPTAVQAPSQDDTLKEPPELEEWRSIYLQYLDNQEQGGPCTYALIYVDEDDIPELVIDTGVEASGCRILTYHDGVVDELQTMRLNFTYIEKANLLCNADGNMGRYYDSVYSIRDGKWVYIDGGVYGDGPDGIQYDDDGELICVYNWNGSDVSEEEYHRQLETVYPTQRAGYPNQYYILSDLRALLETGDVASSEHRYELIVQDLTWKEADKLCRDKGGYLATITSQEEFARIQAQMIAEDKTDITFFVGANNEQEDGTFGYHWREADGTCYNMLDHYKALFVFWLKGEPSYTGLTEDGTEVEEEYVVLLYRQADDRCYLNDVPNDILSAAPSYAGRVGYICEYDE